jgi:chromosome segregation ATPase
MALSRKLLTAMGIEAEKIDEIINAHAETVNGLKEERDTARKEADSFREAAEKLPDVEKELNELKEKVKEGNKDPFEPKYNEIKEEFEKYKADIEAKETTSRKRDAYKALLKKVGVSEKRIDAILKVTDISSIELTDKGEIKDADERSEAAKTEWADFIQTSGTEGANTPNPPENTGGNTDKPSRAAQLAQQYRESKYGKEDK